MQPPTQDDHQPGEPIAAAGAESDELAFLRSYESVTLWKPQVVADKVLTGMFLADTTYRASLAALLLQESVEAARRLCAVWHALADRTEPPARRLRRPLPGAAPFTEMARAIGMIEDPREVLARLGVGESAAESAEELVAFGGLSWFAEAIRCAETGPPRVTVLPGSPATLRWNGVDGSGADVAIDVLMEDNQIVALGDATGDFVTWARELLGAYVDARSGRG